LCFLVEEIKFNFRHLEPALAYQLEINRMKNFELEPIPTTNRRMHLYLGRAYSSPPGSTERVLVGLCSAAFSPFF
jgi:hypothetical protein